MHADSPSLQTTQLKLPAMSFMFTELPLMIKFLGTYKMSLEQHFMPFLINCMFQTFQMLNVFICNNIATPERQMTRNI